MIIVMLMLMTLMKMALPDNSGDEEIRIMKIISVITPAALMKILMMTEILIITSMAWNFVTAIRIKPAIDSSLQMRG